MKRILELEGLRGYLAFWVLIDHLLVACGYSYSSLNGLVKIARAGWYAVDLFIIISGFVIFYLLDQKQESYFTFITRRFFRIFPLFIFLFIFSIPLSSTLLSNADQFALIYPSAQFGELPQMINAGFDYIWPNIFLHLTMLHGIVPQNIIPYAPSAFLGAGWSISLEWQFYLIAPFVFNFLTKSSNKYKIIIISTIVFLLFHFSKELPFVQFGAFLPMHIEYFYIGGLSYFLYKNFNHIFHNDSILISLIIFSLILFTYSKNLDILPVCIWISFFGLMISMKNSSQNMPSNKISILFNNRFSQYLGKISYSIYLAHFPIIIIIQSLLLSYLPQLHRREHFVYLSFIAIPVIIFISDLLYSCIEVKAIEISKNILNKKTSNKLRK